MNIGEGGVTTTYELSTFTPSFGRLSKINTERLKSAAKQRVMQSKNGKTNGIYEKLYSNG